MPQSIFLFDFGGDEDAAQLARRKVEAWKQGFRLGNKMLMKFDRAERNGQFEPAKAEASATGGKKAPKGKKDAEAESSGKPQVQVLLRLDFSDHEKLSHQRWLDRIPNEDPFAQVQGRVVRSTDADFAATAERFDGLN